MGQQSRPPFGRSDIAVASDDRHIARQRNKHGLPSKNGGEPRRVRILTTIQSESVAGNESNGQAHTSAI